jgi:hypothetical protein
MAERYCAWERDRFSDAAFRSSEGRWIHEKTNPLHYSDGMEVNGDRPEPEAAPPNADPAAEQD